MNQIHVNLRWIWWRTKIIPEPINHSKIQFCSSNWLLQITNYEAWAAKSIMYIVVLCPISNFFDELSWACSSVWKCLMLRFYWCVRVLCPAITLAFVESDSGAFVRGRRNDSEWHCSAPAGVQCLCICDPSRCYALCLFQTHADYCIVIIVSLHDLLP